MQRDIMVKESSRPGRMYTVIQTYRPGPMQTSNTQWEELPWYAPIGESLRKRGYARPLWQVKEMHWNIDDWRFRSLDIHPQGSSLPKRVKVICPKCVCVHALLCHPYWMLHLFISQGCLTSVREVSLGIQFQTLCVCFVLWGWRAVNSLSSCEVPPKPFKLFSPLCCLIDIHADWWYQHNQTVIET